MMTELNERDGLDLWRRTISASVRSNAPDLTARQQAILMIVALTPGPHTVRGLATDLSIAKPAVTRALDTLSALGLVRRQRDRRDMRSVLVARTEKGAAHLRALAELISLAAKGEDVRPSPDMDRAAA